MLAITEIAAVVFAVAYLLLAIRQNVLCWPAALVSVVLFAVVFVNARLYMQGLLQAYYFAMGIYGWREWLHGGADHRGVRVTWWGWSPHLVSLAIIAVGTAGFGYFLSAMDVSAENAAVHPYLDSFATVSALIATYMLAKKVIENWLYWFVIDSVLVFLSWQSGLIWTTSLYLLYLVLVVTGFMAWFKAVRIDGYGSDEAVSA